MLKKYSIVVVTLQLILAREHDHYDHIKKEMEKDGIVPTILPDAPHHHLHIDYHKDKHVHLGNELTPSEVNDEPQVKWEANPQKYYTLVMFDPDAPSRENPTFSDVKHWLVGNILGGDVNTGDVIAEYYGSGPPKGTGLHRYIFLVYEQEDTITFDEPRSEKLSRAHRLKWSLKQFVDKYNLRDPLAGDYFKAQWEPFVDEKNKQIRNY